MAITNKPPTKCETWNSFYNWSENYSHHKSKYIYNLLQKHHITSWCRRPTAAQVKDTDCLFFETFGECNHYKCKRDQILSYFFNHPKDIPGSQELDQNNI